MSEQISEDLEKKKKEFVMLQGKINKLQDELKTLTVQRERLYGMILLLEDQLKKSQITET